MNDTQLLDQLAQCLADDRHRMTVLSYELTVARLLLASGDHRFVPDALRAVERTLERMRREEEVGHEALRELAAARRVDPENLSLEGLARTVPPPLDHLFAEHLAAVHTLVAEIRGATEAHPTLARCDLRAAIARLDRLAGAAPTPLPDVVEGPVELRVQQDAYEATFPAIRRAPPPSLVAFLG